MFVSIFFKAFFFAFVQVKGCRVPVNVNELFSGIK